MSVALRPARLLGLLVILLATAVAAVLLRPAPLVPGVAGWLGAPPAATDAAALLRRLPVRFEPNHGQADPAVRFLARGPGHAVLLGDDAVLLRLRAPVPSALDWRGLLARARAALAPATATLRLTLVDRDAAARWAAGEPLPGQSHYLLGDRPDAWVRAVPQFASLRQAGVYPGIDLVFHGAGGALEHDFIVAPGADPARIEWQIDGAARLAPDAAGDLPLATPAGTLVLRRPVAYQALADGSRRPVPVRFAVRGGDRVGFDVGAYDRALPLVIDPVLAWASVFGGEVGSTTTLGLAVDASGATYVSGATCDLQFPVTPGALGTAGVDVFGSDDCEDAFVTKLAPDGASLVYSTFLGGTGRDAAARIAVDGSGAVYATGITLSADFPTTPGAFDRTFAGGTCSLVLGVQVTCGDAFVAKLAPDGSQLAYATYLGAARFDFGIGIAIDDLGAAYVQGWTNSADFPVSPGAPQGTWGGGSCFGGFTPCYDSFVAKLDPAGASLAYATYLGGSRHEYALGIAVDAGRNAYVTGSTESGNFPVTPGAFATTGQAAAGSPDAYVARLNAAGTAWTYATYLGGTSGDVGFDVAVDTGGSLLVAGTTDSADFPVTPGAWRTTPQLPGFGCILDIVQLITCDEGFVVRLNASGSALGFATYIGGDGKDAALAVAPTGTGGVWVAGQTSSSAFPTTADALYPAGQGAFLGRLAGDGGTLEYLTLLNGSSGFGNTATALRPGSAGSVYVAGIAAGQPTIATPGAYRSDAAQGAFVLRLDPGTGATLAAAPASLTFPATPRFATATPRTVTLTNTGGTGTPLAIEVAPDGVGVSADEFPQTSDCPAVLAPAASCTLTVGFQPEATGNRSAGLLVASRAGGNPLRIPLAGLGATLDDGGFVPAQLDFAPQAAGTQSPVGLTAIVRYQASNFPAPAAVALAGSNPGDFTIDTSNCNPSAFGCFLAARFAPAVGAAPGPRSATVLVTDAAANSPRSLLLTGTVATGPVANVQPARLDFEAQPVGGGTSLAVTVNNGGDAPLVFGSTTVTGADYSVTSNACVASLAPQASCQVTVRLQPAGTGARAGQLAIASNAPGSPVLVPLAGAGSTGGILRVFGGTGGNFGPVVVGKPGVLNEILLLQNAGTTALTGLALATTGDFALAANDCGATLASGASCGAQVGFTPTATGPRTGTLTITSSSPDSPRVLPLSGTGVLLPVARLTPAAVDFGDVATGTTAAPVVLTLANTGGGALQVAGISVPAPFTQVSSCGASLAAGTTCTITVGFAPTATGPRSALLQVLDNAAGGRRTVQLAGRGVTGPALRVRPERVDFGSQAVGGSSAPVAVTVTNSGDATVVLTGVVAARNFSQTNNCGASLAAGASCTIQARFAPLSPSPVPTDAIVGALNIGTANLPGPVQVRLAGIGTSGGGGGTPAATLSATSVAFGAVNVGNTATGSAVTLSNTGTAALAISSITITGADAAAFSQTNTCPASLAAGTSCTLTARFSPTATGARAASLQVTDSAAGSPRAIALAGTGVDFGVSATSASAAVAAGDSVAVPLTVTTGGAPLAAGVTLSVTGLPSGATASFAPATLAAGSVDPATTLTVTTTARPATAAVQGAPPAVALAGATQPLLWWLGGLLVLAARRRARLLLALVLATAVVATAGCGGGGGGGPPAAGTPAGTYPLTIRATAGGIERTTVVDLVVS